MSNCNSCSKALPDEAKFCMACGSPVLVSCLSCGKEMQPEANFCIVCGSAKGFGLSEEDWVDMPAGEFLMGVDEPDYDPPHLVRIEAFSMLATPVTFTMYDIFCGATDREKPSDQSWGRGNRPVIDVSYWNAVDYCQWLSERTGQKIRLPTDAEWEYACRAGTTTPFWTGETITGDEANFLNRQTTPVKLYDPNLWGLYDMTGNVLEWCSSEYGEGLETKDASADRSNNNPRTVRGGYWGNDDISSLCSGDSQRDQRPENAGPMFGFRVARNQ